MRAGVLAMPIIVLPPRRLKKLLGKLRRELPGCKDRDDGRKAEKILWQILIFNIVNLHGRHVHLLEQAIREFEESAPSVFDRICRNVAKLNEFIG